MNFLIRTLIFPAAILATFCLFGLPINAQTDVTEPQIARNVEPTAEKEKPTEAKAPESTKPDPAAVILNRVGTNGAQTRSITLNEAIRKALENNNDIEIAKDNVRVSETQLRSLLGIYDPVFTVTPTFTHNSSTGSTATNDFRANGSFFQNVKPGGGNYTVFFNNTRSENSFTQAQLSNSLSGGSTSAVYQTSTGVTFSQPLFRDFKIDNNRRQIKIQRKRLQQSDADFRRQTLTTISQVQNGYWDLVFALRDQQNKTANLNLAKESLRQIEAKITAGTAAPLERAEVATELANRETDLLLAVQQVGIAENNLKQLFLKDPTSPEWSDSLIPTDQPVFSQDTIVLEDAMKDAMANRPELSRLKLEKEVNQIDIDYFKNQVKPQIDLNGTFSLNGFAQAGSLTNPSVTTSQFTGNNEILRQNLNLLLINSNLTPIANPTTTTFANPALFGGFPQALSNIFRSDAPNFSIGVSIQFPLRNTTAKANLAGAKISQEQVAAQTRSQEQIITAEVRNAVQAVETARQRVLTSRRARENAEIQLQGERKLYDAGRSTTFLLFQRENALAAARNSEIRAETDYNKALANLQRATSTTFSANGIEIESPVKDK